MVEISPEQMLEDSTERTKQVPDVCALPSDGRLYK